MARTEAAFHNFGYGADVEGALILLGIDGADLRSEERAGADRGEELAVGFECAGVGLEVSRIVELCGIHEDADDAAITFAESSLDEAQVSSVKCPHSGDEGDAMPLRTLRRYEGLEVFDALI